MKQLFFSPVTDDEWGREVLRGKRLRSGEIVELSAVIPLEELSHYSFQLYDIDGSVYEVLDRKVTTDIPVEITNDDKAPY
ncbi:hypothetical protein FACS1894172_10180 [Spirochaetia bacterium]|nr:hypothetical protein FACS1894164_10220 [Spirochaetia bacterium]GHU32834.1 hypothetical protein FACS1894172_10180 [Spirochaetia bacterium]